MQVGILKKSSIIALNVSYITPGGAKNMRGGQFLWENYMDQ